MRHTLYLLLEWSLTGINICCIFRIYVPFYFVLHPNYSSLLFMISLWLFCVQRQCTLPNHFLQRYNLSCTLLRPIYGNYSHSLLLNNLHNHSHYSHLILLFFLLIYYFLSFFFSSAHCLSFCVLCFATLVEITINGTGRIHGLFFDSIYID